LTVPYRRQRTGREAAYVALLLVANESSYVDARARFLDGSHPGGIGRGWNTVS
jgi:hypothetical protein